MFCFIVICFFIYFHYFVAFDNKKGCDRRHVLLQLQVHTRWHANLSLTQTKPFSVPYTINSPLPHSYTQTQYAPTSAYGHRSRHPVGPSIHTTLCYPSFYNPPMYTCQPCHPTPPYTIFVHMDMPLTFKFTDITHQQCLQLNL